jgi:hypothetical protein
MAAKPLLEDRWLSRDISTGMIKGGGFVMSRIHRTTFCAFLLLPLLAAPGKAADSGILAGQWEGVTLIKPGEFEVEIEATFSRENDGAAVGKLSFTTNGELDRPIHDLSVEDSRVRFAVTDDAGIVSSFQGWLTPEGSMIDGDLEEQGAHYLFKLHRNDSPKPPAQPVRQLSRNGVELTKLFNETPARVRLLLIVSPSCPLCKSGLGIVQRYVLDQIKDPGLRVFVVWEPALAHETSASVAAASRFISDPRVVQLWEDEHRFAGQAFAGVLKTGAPAWDVYLAFPGDIRWADAAPSPAFIMSNMPGEQAPPNYPHLNGPELANQIKRLLEQPAR